MKKSYNELGKIKSALSNLLDSDEKYHRKMVLNLNKNMRLIEDELDDLRASMKQLPDRFEDYRTDIYNHAIECGAEETRQGLNLNVDGFDSDKFEQGIKKLDNEYSKALEEVKEIREYNNKLTEEDVDVDLLTFKLEWFPENMSGRNMPSEIVELIEE